MNTVFLVDDEPGDDVRIQPGTLRVGKTVYPVLAQVVSEEALQHELSTALREHTAANAPNLVISLLTPDAALAGAVFSAVDGRCCRATALAEGELRDLDPQCLRTPALFQEAVAKVQVSAVVSSFSGYSGSALLFQPTAAFFAAICGLSDISQQDEQAFICALEQHASWDGCAVQTMLVARKSQIDAVLIEMHMLAIHYCDAREIVLGPALAYERLVFAQAERLEMPAEKPLRSFQIDNERQLNELHDALKKRAVAYDFEEDTRRELDSLRRLVAEATARRKALVAELDQKQERAREIAKARAWNADLYVKKRKLQLEREFLQQLERMLAEIEK